MNFIDLVKIKYDKFTSSEKKIADYIVANSEEFLNSNAHCIGELTKTSAASVIRFCKKLGFDGLEQLKVHVAKSQNTLQEDSEIDPIMQSDDTQDVMVAKLYSQIETSLKKTIDLLDYDVLKNVIKIVKKANRVYLYGIGASSLSAYDLYHKFNRVNKQTFYGFDGHMNIEFSVHATSEDVAIAFSYAGDSKEITLAVEQLKKNGTPVIAVVKEGDTILGNLADYCIYVPDLEKTIKMGALSSKFSQNFIADIIYFGTVQNNLDDVFAQLKSTSKVTRPLKDKKM